MTYCTKMKSLFAVFNLCLLRWLSGLRIPFGTMHTKKIICLTVLLRLSALTIICTSVNTQKTWFANFGKSEMQNNAHRQRDDVCVPKPWLQTEISTRCVLHKAERTWGKNNGTHQAWFSVRNEKLKTVENFSFYIFETIWVLKVKTTS